jgi:hypothetical protein
MTNLVEIVTSTMQTVGAGDADWRVQACGAVLLIIAGIGGMWVENIRQKRKARKGGDKLPTVPS